MKFHWQLVLGEILLLIVCCLFWDFFPLHFILIFNALKLPLWVVKIVLALSVSLLWISFKKYIILFLAVNKLVNATFVSHSVNALPDFSFCLSQSAQGHCCLQEFCYNAFPTTFLLLNVQYPTRSTFFQCVLQKVALNMAHQKQSEFGNFNTTSLQGYSLITWGEKRETNVYYLAH